MTENTEMQQNEAKHIYQNLSQEFSDQLFVAEVGVMPSGAHASDGWYLLTRSLRRDVRNLNTCSELGKRCQELPATALSPTQCLALL